MKFKLGFGEWFFKLDNGYEYKCYIGCNGNLTYTDSLGNRYVPFDKNGKDRRDVEALMFSEAEYIVVTPNGHTFKLTNAVNLED